MIDYLFYTFLCVFFVVLETAIFPGIGLFDTSYDLLIPFVLYLALFRSIFEGLSIALILGFIMDSLTGGPFGIYMAIYFWLVVVVRWGMQYLHYDTIILLPLVICVGVLFENMILLVVSAIVWNKSIFPTGGGGLLAWQVLWALITGPLILVVIKRAHTDLNVWGEKFSLSHKSRG